MRHWSVPTVIVTLLLSGLAHARTDSVSFVPWKVLKLDAEPLRGPLVLFWIPASRDEVKRSLMLTSRELSLAATQCVGLQVVQPNDVRVLDLLGVTTRPSAILLDQDGREIARVEAAKGEQLRVSLVEAMVRDALDARATEADGMLDRAREQLGDGAAEAALETYRRVWEQRCLCPRQGREAQRAMKKLSRK